MYFIEWGFFGFLCLLSSCSDGPRVTSLCEVKPLKVGVRFFYFPKCSSFLPGNSHVTMWISTWVNGGKDGMKEVFATLDFILNFMANELSLKLKNKPFSFIVLNFWLQESIRKRICLIREKWYYYRKPWDVRALWGCLEVWVVVCLSAFCLFLRSEMALVETCRKVFLKLDVDKN